MPHNQYRKAVYLKRCILMLEELQRRYQVFDDDPTITVPLELMRNAHEDVMAELRRREDADELFAEMFQEDV